MEIEQEREIKFTSGLGKEPEIGTFIGSREKVNLMAKKILLYIYFHNKLILDFTELHKKFGGDLKKFLEIIMILEGIGFVKRIKNTDIIFTGFKGFILKFNEYVKTWDKKPWRIDPPAEASPSQAQKIKIEEEEEITQELSLAKNQLQYEQELEEDIIKISNIKINLTPFKKVGEFASSLLFELLLTFNKIISKTEVEEKYKKYDKFVNNKIIKVTNMEIQKILNGFSLIDINQNLHNIVWSGPDCLNILGLNSVTLREHPYVKDTINDAFEKFITEFPYELGIRESSFFHKFYSDFLTGFNKMKIDLRWFDYDFGTFEEFRDIKKFNEYGFAVLKNRNGNFFLKKTYAIIGRKSENPNLGYEWDVDLNLRGNEKVSKQHALIAFNFKKGNFEISCLSKKNGVFVNRKNLKIDDEPCPLYDESMIKIGGEVFHFLLPSVVNSVNFNK